MCVNEKNDERFPTSYEFEFDNLCRVVINGNERDSLGVRGERTVVANCVMSARRA